jgi:2-iminobutanoate/2-iminopropanoate deaminase
VSTEIRRVTAANAPAPAGPYSQGIVAGGLIFVSGQVPRAALTGLVPDGIQAQTRLALKNVESILQAAGVSMKDVVKVSAHLVDLDLFEAFNQAYLEFFTKPFPARTTVGSELRGVLVEVDVIAVLPNEVRQQSAV